MKTFTYTNKNTLCLLAIIRANSITEADVKFYRQTKINPTSKWVSLKVK